uniref:Uncharacterized protein n=1 Tax=Arundo donax TaxID=35708 RepID=A0A0A9HSV5_ARUDO
MVMMQMSQSWSTCSSSGSPRTILWCDMRRSASKEMWPNRSWHRHASSS